MSEEDKNINDELDLDVGSEDSSSGEEEQDNQDETPFFNFDDEEKADEPKSEEKEDKPEKTAETPQGDFVSKEEYESFKREQQIDKFLNNPDNEDYKNFEGKIKELAAKPQAKGLTVQALARMAVPESYWVKKGAEIAGQAGQESREGYTGGASARDEVKKGSSSELPDPYDIKDPDEFMATAMNMARKD